MIGRIIGLLWTLLTLPIRVVLLPYKIISALVSLVIYALVLAILGGVIYVFVI